MYQSRRTFIKQVSTTAALGVLGESISPRLLWSVPSGERIPEPDEALLRRLALVAVDAARSAGSAFADVRVTGGRQLVISASFDRSRGRPMLGWPTLTLRTEYGIRALVDGAWGFAGGSVLEPEAVADTVRTAVARARANRPRRPRALELAPAARVEDGRWSTPIERDPFAVPVGEQADLALAAVDAVVGVRGATSGTANFRWTESLRVFASTEGSLTVQRIRIALPRASAAGSPPDDDRRYRENVEVLRSGGYGYEAVTHVDLVAELRAAAERAVARAEEEYPETPAEVGRYDLVLSGQAAASVLGTIAEAINLERVLGYRANRDGTSFAAPPSEVLGQLQMASPLVTVRADRTQPHAPATVGWDDEGVPAGAYTVIQDGVLMDFHSTRQTAAELAEWYASRSEPVRSTGCASGGGQQLPAVRVPNLTLEPGMAEQSVDDLITDTSRGLYIDACGGGSDPQVLTAQFRGRGVREIRNGKLGDLVSDVAFQFVTPEWWKRVDALGGPDSVTEALAWTGLSAQDPLQLPYARVRTVPLRVRAVNVLNTGRPPA